MKEKPIIFSAPMVRAILEGRKTQTRRIVKPQPPPHAREVCLAGESVVYRPIHDRPTLDGDGGWMGLSKCPYPPSTRLWVRENYRAGREWDDTKPSQIDPLCGGNQIRYEADGVFIEHSPRADETTRPMPCNIEDGWGKLRAGRFMVKWMSRITLEVVSVRVERVQDISEEDAIAEGIVELTKDGVVKKYAILDRGDMSSVPWQDMPRTAREAFSFGWTDIHGPGAWVRNEWVWAIAFRRVDA